MGRAAGLARNDGRLAADYSAVAGTNTQVTVSGHAPRPRSAIQHVPETAVQPGLPGSGVVFGSDRLVVDVREVATEADDP